MQEKLRLLMAQQRFDYAKLSRAAGCSESNIRKIVDGGSEPKLGLAARLASALGVPLAWLADEAQDWPPPAAGADERALELVRSALDNAGLLGELTDLERRALAALRALPPERRGEIVGFLTGLSAERAAPPSGGLPSSPGETLGERLNRDREQSRKRKTG